MKNWVQGAKSYVKAGLSPVPIPKMWLDPEHKDYKYLWKEFQSRIMTPAEIEREFKAAQGIGIVTGAVSGNLVVIDVDSLGVWERWERSLKSEWPELYAKLVIESSPKGRHVYVRVPGEPPRNEKWAMVERDKKMVVAIETRGEGGLIFCAPTPGYEMIQGKLTNIQTLTQSEFDWLYGLSASLNEEVGPVKVRHTDTGLNQTAGERPGDVFNGRAGWNDLLTRAGAKVVSQRSGRTLLTRPGKDHGVSATISQGRNGAEVLYNFSSNWLGLEPGTYSKFAFYTYTQHGGDWKKATRAAAELYNVPPPPVRTSKPALASVDGGLALQPEPEPAAEAWEADDVGNAQEFERIARGKLLYCHEWGRWVAWDGKRWLTKAVGSNAAHALYMEMIEPLRTSDPAWWKKCRTRARVESTLALAKNLNGLACSPNDFDQDPWILNTQSGIVSLKTGAIIPHDPEMRCSKITACGVADLGGKDRKIDTFIDEIMMGDGSLIDSLGRWFGYTLTGTTREQKYALATGSGRNGKGVLTNVFHRILADYAVNVDASLILSSKMDRPLYALETLAGARFVKIEEPDKRRALDREFLKKLVAGDPMMVAAKYGHPYTIRPTGKLMICANHKPTVEFDFAFERRTIVYPFALTLSSEDIDPEYENKLVECGDEVLAWAIAGCLRYVEHGLSVTDSMVEQLQSYKEENDHVAQFLADWTRDMRDTGTAGGFIYVESGVLTEAYNQWAKAVRAPAMGQTEFGAKMRLKGFSTEKVGKANRKGYAGLKLLDAHERGDSVEDQNQ